jgi:multiple sugar transport system permease protein
MSPTPAPRHERSGPRVSPPLAVQPARRSMKQRRRRDDLRALPYLTPWIIGVGVFFLYPLAATVYFSFTRYDQINPPIFVGLANWKSVLGENPLFYPALRNSLWLVAVMVPARTVVGLGLGLLVMRIKRGVGAFRTLLYLPYLAPPVAATLAFVFLLNPGTGPVNQGLDRIGISAPNWFSDPATAKPALTLLAVWGVGDLMIIFLASLLDVPREQYEAATLDGAGAFQQFRYVTLPTIRPIILFALVTGVIQSMQYYTQAIVAGKVASGTSIGPGTTFDPGYPDGSTLTLPQLIYSSGFQHFDTGAASVIAVILVCISLAFTMLLLRRGAGFLSSEDLP